MGSLRGTHPSASHLFGMNRHVYRLWYVNTDYSGALVLAKIDWSMLARVIDPTPSSATSQQCIGPSLLFLGTPADKVSTTASLT